MTIDILICTINDGITRIPDVLMPPMDGVRYVVCMQYTDEEWLEKVPMKVMMRKDVKFYVHEGRGLSRNRNFALDWAEADICVIADDDNRYQPQYIENIRQAYAEHPDADIICFAAESYDGRPMKRYPDRPMPFAQAMKQGYYPASIEITFRTSKVRTAELRFDERFGLGSGRYNAGEEDILLKDAQDKGLQVQFVPKTIVNSGYDTTGLHFAEDPQLQVTKGAVFHYIFGKRPALWRSFKESLWWMLRKGRNPFPIFINMCKGIWTLQS